ncbi:MAG: response regulator transcription factor [Thermodesulfobacteriota bacterium]
MNQKKILIVEDETNLAKVIQFNLERAGYRTEGASDGAEAMEKIDLSPPDLVLLDLLIPSIDGWEVARRIRGNPETKDIKILMLSIVSNGKKASEVGADGYIVKPFSMEKLLNTVNSLLR